MEAVASQAGVALEHARLFRDNQRRVQELSVLHELSRAVTGRLDRAGLEAPSTSRWPASSTSQHGLLLHDEAPDELEVVLRIADGAPRRRRAAPVPAPRGGLMSVVLETGRPIRTADYVGRVRAARGDAVAARVELRYWLGVPMRAGDERSACSSLRSPDRAFTDADEHLLANIADLAALALRSARLFEERTRAYGELAAAQDQLVRTEKLRALGEMASGVAHDFNNVLAAILGRAQLLLERGPRRRSCGGGSGHRALGHRRRADRAAAPGVHRASAATSRWWR